MRKEILVRCIAMAFVAAIIFAVFAALEAPDAQIEAIEIQAPLVRAVQRNLAQNHCDERVTVRCAVVGGAHNEWSTPF